MKVWFVTGAGSGLGTGIAKAALRAGDRVVATGRNLEKVRNVYPDVAQENIAFVQLEVASEAQAKAAVDEAMKRFGRIDVLVNNAGYSLLGNFEQMTTAEIQQQFATNFYGVVHVMQAALPVMRRQRSGHIINISSVAGVVGLKHCAAYAATKFAVEGLSLSVANEVEKFGIKITVVEPGFFRTDLLDEHNVRWVSKVVEDYAPEVQPRTCGRSITAHNPTIQRSWAMRSSKSSRYKILQKCSLPEAMPSTRLGQRSRSGCGICAPTKCCQKEWRVRSSEENGDSESLK